MRFKDFLLREAKHRQDISVEKARELIEQNCSDMDIRKPFWRGSQNATEEAYLIQGELGGRSSAVSSNHYTVIMDHFLPKKGFPLRSKSIILTNNDGANYARQYAGGHVGGLYAIFPFNGVPIGVCGEKDIWALKTQIGDGNAAKLDKLNDWFEEAGIPDYSYEDLVQGIQDGLEEHDDTSRMLSRFFGSGDHIEDELRIAYTPPVLDVSLHTSKTVPEDKSRELWISGKCVAIHLDVWEKMFEGEDE